MNDNDYMTIIGSRPCQAGMLQVEKLVDVSLERTRGGQGEQM